jgi:selenide,water dikinase
MGGRPLTAMNLLGVPTEKITPTVISQILRGGARKAKEANCAILGGHTIGNPEPIYGLSVTGVVHPKRILTNAAARPGDLLVLTKPLGTGIVSTAIKRGLALPTLARRAINVMKQLNAAGASLAERGLVKAATDVTGFGLLGHLANIVRASRVGAVLHAESIPMLSPAISTLVDQGCVPGGSIENLKSVQSIIDWSGVPEATRILLADAQTSGGLLLCVPPKNLRQVTKILRSHRTPAAAVIGSITRSSRPRILVQP